MSGLLGIDPDRVLPRLLPKDHKVGLAASECERNLEAVAEALREFRSRWYADPPDLDGALRAIHDLVARTDRLRGAAKDLVTIVQPRPP
jgi:hypothetical protein